MQCMRLAAVMVVGMGVAAANAQVSRTHIGTLTCTSGTAGERAEDKDPAAAQAVRMTCGFKPSKAGAEERYIGTVFKGTVGGTATSGKRVLVWSVIGLANSKIVPGALSQRYTIAAEAQALIGESRAIALQSETSDGASGVTQLELILATTPA